jgi:hypothetical protein
MLVDPLDFIANKLPILPLSDKPSSLDSQASMLHFLAVAIALIGLTGITHLEAEIRRRISSWMWMSILVSGYSFEKS